MQAQATWPLTLAHSESSEATHSVEQAREARARRRALEALYRQYQRKAYSVAYGYLANREEALDVVQDAFVRVQRRLDRFEGHSSFYSWLHKIVTNLCIDHLRRRRRRRSVEFDDAESSQANATLCSLSGDPSRFVHGLEIRTAMEACLAELSDSHRSVIVMREILGMSYAEMATAQNIAQGTVMSRLFHARRNLQRLLSERLDHLPEATENAAAA